MDRRSFLAAAGGTASFGAVGLLGYGRTRAGDPSAAPKALVAGSLLGTAEDLGAARIEAHGSAAVRQLVVNDMRDPDAVALADPRLFAGIDSRATCFATNALVVAYAPDSPHAPALERDWHAVQRESVSLGRTDPDTDPLGYRTVMALRLAARSSDLDAGQVLSRAATFPEVDLLNVVANGKLDAAFAYRSMAVEHDLPYVELPDRIDFSSPAHGDIYATVSYDLPDGPTVHGAPIRYAATATSERGDGWVRRLVTAHDLLDRHGFTVPDDYPRAYRVDG